MAFRNKIISNPATGNHITFIQTANETNGQYLEMEATYDFFSKEPPEHYHPNQVEDFTVLSGQLSVRIAGTVNILSVGDTIHIPKNKVHSMWNNTHESVIVNWKVRPALNTEYFLETVYGLAKDGKTNSSGKPNIFQIALLATKFSPTFRLAKPAFLLQRIFFALLSPIAYLLGLKPTYEKYLN